ncbi:uncharacterized protein LOC135496581 [Lineus longissimus]|uniref:uncharacterized protein LOC135496581 n=1 Tax=Lineus longissimus TaxID=88925 RepID=UPI00315DE3CB
MQSSGSDRTASAHPSTPAVWLKEGHSLRGRDMFPVAARLVHPDEVDPENFASLSRRYPLTSYSFDDLGSEFKKLTGYDITKAPEAAAGAPPNVEQGADNNNVPAPHADNEDPAVRLKLLEGEVKRIRQTQEGTSVQTALSQSRFQPDRWELNTGFDPLKATSERRSPRRTECRGSVPSLSSPTVLLLKVWDVKGKNWQDCLDSLSLRDPNSFVAGQLHTEKQNWSILLDQVNDKDSKLVEKWIFNEVEIVDFFQPFKGYFKGEFYDSKLPPAMVFHNAPNCAQHKEDIVSHLEEGLRNGSLELVGKVGEVDPPHLVMPLLMVDGKREKRLCHNEQFLNLWMRHIPFSLEGLSRLPSLLDQGDFMASSDEKSAYLGVCLSPASRTYFGVQFAGWYLRYTVLPFGWSESPYIYQTIGMQVTFIPASPWNDYNSVPRR